MIPPDDTSVLSSELSNLERELKEARAKEETLLARRERLLLDDPQQREERLRSRDLLVGRWRSAQGLDVNDLTALTDGDPLQEWLFTDRVLRADGWKQDATKRWLPPESYFNPRAGSLKTA